MSFLQLVMVDIDHSPVLIGVSGSPIRTRSCESPKSMTSGIGVTDFEIYTT
jgi:hypothetical protein